MTEDDRRRLVERVLDGEAPPEELEGVEGAERLLAEARAVRTALREAVAGRAGAPPELADAVMAALALSDPVPALREALREALAGREVEVADEVMAAVREPGLELSALHDGELAPDRRVVLARRVAADREAMEELARHAELGRLVRTAVRERADQAGTAGTWEAVARGIGLADAEEVTGWAPLARRLREAVEARSALTGEQRRDMVEAVMAALPERVPEPQPGISIEPLLEEPPLEPRRYLWVPVLLALAALFLVVPRLFEPVEPVSAVPEPQALVEVADDNTASLDALEYGDGVLVHVRPAEDGAPLIVVVDELPLDEDEGTEGAAL